MKTLVVGAGVGGLTSALLASLRHENVTLIEAHSLLGGCSSYFRRGSFIFDAGATTISGLGEHEPLGRLFNLIGRRPSLKLADPGIVFHLEHKTVRYYHDFEKWMVELERHFPHLNHRPFWKKVREVNAAGWELLERISAFPIRSPADLLPFLKYPKCILLLPHLMLSTEMVIKHFGLDDPEYLKLIDGILLISAQAESRQVPFLVGAMGLFYPSETYAPIGGMKGIVDFFEDELKKRNVEIKTKSTLAEFSEDSVHLTSGEKVSFNRLILNLPIWNLAKMTQGKLRKQLEKESQIHPGYWGAFTLYMGTKTKVNSPYHQVHLKHAEIPHYFVSFSLLEDSSRSPEGYQTVTISAHVPAESWLSLSETEYRERKAFLNELILKDFKERFAPEEIKFLTAGTPRTFVDFTGRDKGFVGGVPFILGKNPLGLLGHQMGQNLFRVGDTVFPGQGWSGVTAGTLSLHQRLSS